jgi:SAM-dependent methyltransferase
MSLLRVQRDDPEYQRLAAAEMDFWSKPHPFGLESLETIESGGPVDRYNNKRFTGDANIAWYETIPRYGTFRRGLVLGTSAITIEGSILRMNPSLHLTFLDISPGAVARRADLLGRRYPGRVGTRVDDLNFLELEPRSYDLIVSSASIHHVTNLEYVGYQINRALTPDGHFFLQDYVGEPRFQFSEEKRRIFSLLHDRELAAHQPGRQAGLVFDDASDLSPFCGVRSDEVLGVMRDSLSEVEVRTSGALLVAMMRAHPTDLARIPARPPAARRLADWIERRAYALVGKLPPRKSLIPDRWLEEVGGVGDLLADAGMLAPGTAFGIYRKR